MSRKVFQTLRESSHRVRQPSQDGETEGATGQLGPIHRPSCERQRPGAEVDRLEDVVRDNRDLSFETPHKQKVTKSAFCKPRKPDHQEFLEGAPYEDNKRRLSPSPKQDLLPLSRDKISYKKPECLRRSDLRELSTPPRSAEFHISRLNSTDKLASFVSSTPQKYSKSRLYRDVEPRTDSGIRPSSVKRLNDTQRNRSRSPQVRGLNVQAKPEILPCRAVDLLTSETLERRKKFYQINKLEEFIGEVSEICKTNAAVNSDLASRANSLLAQLRGSSLDDGLAKFAKDVCVEVVKSHGKFSTTSLAKLQELYKIAPKPPVTLTPNERELQEAETQLNASINKLTVRKLKELTSSKANQAANIEAGLALLILFSEIDRSIEVSPGFKILRSRAWKTVQAYLAVPGRAANISRNIIDFIRKGQVSPSVVKQAAEQSQQLRLTRDDNSAINLVHEYLGSVFKFYDLWLMHFAPSSYRDKCRALLPHKSAKLKGRSSQRSHGEMTCSTKRSTPRMDFKENTLTATAETFDCETEHDELMQSLGGLRQNSGSFGHENWLQEPFEQTENEDPNLAYEQPKPKSGVEVLLTTDDRTDAAKSHLDSSFHDFLLAKVGQVHSLKAGLDLDSRRLRLATEMTALDMHHAWLEEFIQDLDWSDQLEDINHDLNQTIVAWLELMAQVEHFKAEVKHVYSQLTQD
jgi:hypothetical protein